MRVAFFTAGTTGAGHLVRGLAIQRGLERAGFDGQYRMFGPTLPFALAQSDVYESVEIRSDPMLRDPARAPESELAHQLRRFRPDLLLVDLFWAPLRWILPILELEAWLLLRTCPPSWLIGPARIPFDDRRFARIIGIEPITHRVVREWIDPVVIVNHDECRSRAELRQRFDVPDDQPLVISTHAGKPGEAATLEAWLPRDHHLVNLSLYDEAPLFPAAAWLGGADAVILGAGYNAFWEARWLGYFPRSTFVSFPRKIDDQAYRLRRFADSAMQRNGADTLARWILE